ncbi:MAG: GNAT family N-acetyltransferase [Pseudomonadota bacterium]
MFFIRTAMSSDLPIVQNLILDSWNKTYCSIYGKTEAKKIAERKFSTAGLAQQLDRPNSEFLVADNGTVVGGMAYAEQSVAGIELKQIFVDPAYQSGKTGIHLLIEIENSFMDATKIQLEIEKQNDKAIQFFRNYGFSVANEFTNVDQDMPNIEMLRLEKTIEYAD